MFDTPTPTQQGDLIAAIAKRQEDAAEREIPEKVILVLECLHTLNPLHIPVYEEEGLYLQTFQQYDSFSLVTVDVGEDHKRAFEMRVLHTPEDTKHPSDYVKEGFTQVFGLNAYYHVTTIDGYRPGPWEKRLHRAYLQARRVWQKRLAKEMLAQHQRALEVWGLDLIAKDAAA